MRRLVSLLSIALLAAALAGCGGYYMVKDPSSQATFYTKHIDKMPGGAIKFTDAKTDSEVTLQASQVSEISSDDWNKAVGK
ncbi:MAG: hypothetical protein R3286_01050 [Gammaproteobacteria bacterium]|nr:hypothetical protein [Gammaproteobacteria bacterium]